ncbi:hypothetical protein BASA82_000890 [Batrachochytrium salamandrivorans]|uniref:Glutathione transferase n=1 Tax=Batrachochytrium salamandrivorans TaxID=1357716 RepID=A0ABQ8FGM6_9FUNG|nr:hypothetical protein BASA60_007722 [Batrachochytrium salamandrivorans]KAH6576775.1 hypothetical protein BASA62_001226 [Batrachochytrium salamandrivorans]KAH6597959.1 hypothetical protein BASA50_004113 [Batrachochytrium salamandrivorans]KAH9262060.1 hypothetical protein BASA82_000890 [Batrachochytrium salamandrivorans]KAJ1344522.1 hypothetical protein BSLG_000046 [Batrachochytrium salamandrivorans]
MLVTAGYASLAAVFGLGLTVNIIRYRRKLKVSLGDGTHEQIVELLQRYTDKGPEILEKFEFSTPYGSKYFKLTQAVRAYGNFIETAPWAFLLIGLAEYNGLDAVYVHTLLALVLGMRVMHAFSLVGYKYAFGLGRAVSTFSTMGLLFGVSCWNILKIWF